MEPVDSVLAALQPLKDYLDLYRSNSLDALALADEKKPKPVINEKDVQRRMKHTAQESVFQRMREYLEW